MQGVEPAAGLVHGLGDEVGRELLAAVDQLPVLERVVMLGEGHGARVEPGVDHLFHPPHRPLPALGAGPGELVDEGAVRIELRGIVDVRRLLAPGNREQLLVGADHLLMRALDAAPDRQRSPPVAAARQRPVHHVLQPVAEPPLADVLGVPVDGAVLGDQLVLLLGGADEPAGGRVVEERPVAAPAEGVAVAVAVAVEHQAAALQILDDPGVGVLEPEAGERAGSRDHLPLAVDREDHRQAVAPAGLVVVLAEWRRGVDEPGAVRGRDVVAEHHAAGDVRLEEGEQAVVEHPLQVAPPEAGEGRRVPQIDLLALSILVDRHGHGRAQVLTQQDEVPRLPRVLDDLIDKVRMHGEADVGDRRPGGGGPGDHVEVVPGLPALPLGGGGDRLPRPGVEEGPDGGIVRVLVVLRDLVARQGGAAAGAVGLDLVPLVEQAAPGELGKGPPDRFDVAVGVGEIGVIEVDPVADALGHCPPLLLIGVDAVQARLVELGDAVGLDLLLAGEAETLLDLDLDGEAMGVPPGLAGHVIAAHGAVAGEEIFHHAGDDMPHVRHVVGGGRPLEEDELPRGGRLLEALLEDPPLLPLFEHLQLELREGISTRNVRESFVAHQEDSSRAALPGREAAKSAYCSGVVKGPRPCCEFSPGEGLDTRRYQE